GAGAGAGAPTLSVEVPKFSVSELQHIQSFYSIIVTEAQKVFGEGDTETDLLRELENDLTNILNQIDYYKTVIQNIFIDYMDQFCNNTALAKSFTMNDETAKNAAEQLEILYKQEELIKIGILNAKMDKVLETVQINSGSDPILSEKTFVYAKACSGITPDMLSRLGINSGQSLASVLEKLKNYIDMQP
ncbi:hypothetical protein IJ384_00005, partial [bacterium]|nr:hypothetical protein [bacterium]